MKVQVLDSNCVPYKKHKTDAGWDLSNTTEFSIRAQGVKAVPLGVKVEIPEGYVGLLVPRSGISTKKNLSLANTVGVIDSDYRGEVVAQIKNDDQKRILRVGKYTRICQLLIVPVVLDELEIVKELSETERGDGGFGSTGENNEENNEEAESQERQDSNTEKDIQGEASPESKDGTSAGTGKGTEETKTSS